MAENRSLREGGPRVKFSSTRQPLSQDLKLPWRVLGNALQLLEVEGLAPLLVDGNIGGNGAMRMGDKMLVSRSGKEAGKLVTQDDVCLVTHFDKDAWHVGYQSASPNVRPSSDTPLLYQALLRGTTEHGWSRSPRVALHGHALHTTADAVRLGLPISKEETVFSTREDLTALEGMFSQYPYPNNKIFLRRGHGFFLLADSMEEAIALVKTVVLPYFKRPPPLSAL